MTEGVVASACRAGRVDFPHGRGWRPLPWRRTVRRDGGKGRKPVHACVRMRSGVRRECKRLGRTTQTVTQVWSPYDRLFASAARVHYRLIRELPSPVPISPAKAGLPHSVQLCGIADPESAPCFSSDLRPISPTLSSIHDKSSGLSLPTMTHITLGNTICLLFGTEICPPPQNLGSQRVSAPIDVEPARRITFRPPWPALPVASARTSWASGKMIVLSLHTQEIDAIDRLAITWAHSCVCACAGRFNP